MRFTLLSLAALAGALALAQDEEKPWEGSVNLNANLSISNRDTQAIFIFADAARRMSGNDLKLKALYAFARQNAANGGPFSTTEDRWSLSGRYDFRLAVGSRTFGYFSERLDRDSVAGLNFRSLTSAGVGTNVGERDAMNQAGHKDWRVSIGGSYLTEEYNTGGNDNYFGLEFGSDFGLILGASGEEKERRYTRLNHSLSWIPEAGNFSDYLLVSDLSISADIGGSWKATLGFLFDYDTTPAPGARKDNYKYVLGLGYKF